MACDGEFLNRRYFRIQGVSTVYRGTAVGAVRRA